MAIEYEDEFEEKINIINNPKDGDCIYAEEWKSWKANPPAYLICRYDNNHNYQWIAKTSNHYTHGWYICHQDIRVNGYFDTFGFHQRTWLLYER